VGAHVPRKVANHERTPRPQLDEQRSGSAWERSAGLAPPAVPRRSRTELQGSVEWRNVEGCIVPAAVLGRPKVRGIPIGRRLACVEVRGPVGSDLSVPPTEPRGRSLLVVVRFSPSTQLNSSLPSFVRGVRFDRWIGVVSTSAVRTSVPFDKGALPFPK